MAGCIKPRLDSPDFQERKRAVVRLSDQAQLAKVAIEDTNEDVRSAAVKTLTDDTSLVAVAAQRAKLVTRGNSFDRTRDAALERLRTLGFLPSRLMEGSPIERAVTLSGVSESYVGLRALAGNVSQPTLDAREAIARIKLATQEPRVRGRFPRIEFTVIINSVDESYYPESENLPGMHPGLLVGEYVTVGGESVTFVLQVPGVFSASRQWKTVFPKHHEAAPGFEAAKVDCTELLADLLAQPLFTNEDRAELRRSSIAEVRLAAALAYR